MRNLKPFKAGDSRINRDGRPKKSILIESLMDKHDTEKVVQAIYNKAVKGNLQACQMWIEHKFGKPQIRVYQEIKDLDSARAFVDYTKLSPKALKEVLDNTIHHEDE